jgi:glyoxylase-like metal-dependent hydrolase (beta-lactamase superfamily II)
MAVKRVIKSVHLIPMGFANAFLIEGDDGLTLIDASFPGKEAAAFGAIRGLGRSLEQLKHLIFTHGHPDHIGSAAAIVRETGARTYMHRLDIPMAESGGPFRPMIPAPGLVGLLCKVFYHPDERVQPVAIDQPLTDGEILPIAGGFEVIHTPGHCAGQVALLWPPGPTGSLPRVYGRGQGSRSTSWRCRQRSERPPATAVRGATGLSSRAAWLHREEPNQ